MKKLSKSNWLFSFYPVANKSANHWCKLAHFTLQKHKMAALELDLSKMLMSAFILKCHKMLLMSHFDKTVMSIGYIITTKGPPTDTWIKNLNIVGIKDN